MITFDEFINKWNGKFIDFDGAYGPQCMDLMHEYVVEVLGITDRTVLSAPYAALVYTNFDNISGHDKFDRIPNTPDGVPQKGDILFFGTGINGGYGHVCIFISGDVYSFRSLDQNFPTGSTVHVQWHNYNYCLGWLRAKTTQTYQQKVHDIVYSTMGDTQKVLAVQAITPK